jgi:two-component sensor histidine kinase
VADAHQRHAAGDQRTGLRAQKSDGDGRSPSTIEALLADATSLELVESEIRHRFKNIVTVTQSLVNQTLRDGIPTAQARESLNRRLSAMGAAIDLLLKNDWQPGSFRETVGKALALHDGYHDRIHCDGPELMIGSNAVLALTLALHELGTNAIKHGALSEPDGAVNLFWKLIDGPPGPRFWMQWVEHDGPPVTPPSGTGFGSRLIGKATARALGGEADLDFNPGGLNWVLIAPLDRIAA